tara:strand:+ start:2258 stop:2635 length:378 start_codon:yes stop_codon:yes gene_type:complete
MRKYVLTGGNFALLALVLGAFATHELKAHFSAEVLQSFQTGIRYMMYHGLALIVFSKISWAKNPIIYRLFFWGIILFSGSILILCLGKLTPFDFSWLGPVTPIGGGLLIMGWASLIWKTYQNKNY